VIKCFNCGDEVEEDVTSAFMDNSHRYRRWRHVEHSRQVCFLQQPASPRAVPEPRALYELIMNEMTRQDVAE
jgi:hypothetical protein